MRVGDVGACTIIYGIACCSLNGIPRNGNAVAGSCQFILNRRGRNRLRSRYFLSGGFAAFARAVDSFHPNIIRCIIFQPGDRFACAAPPAYCCRIGYALACTVIYLVACRSLGFAPGNSNFVAGNCRRILNRHFRKLLWRSDVHPAGLFAFASGIRRSYPGIVRRFICQIIYSRACNISCDDWFSVGEVTAFTIIYSIACCPFRRTPGNGNAVAGRRGRILFRRARYSNIAMSHRPIACICTRFNGNCFEICS